MATSESPRRDGGATTTQEQQRAPAAALSAARREYERARWRGAMALGWFVLPMAALAVARGAPVFWAALDAAALAALSALLLWRGQAYGAAVVPGITAGAVPMLAPMVLRQGAHLCALGSCMMVGSTLFFATGLVAGGIVSAFTLRRHAGQRAFLVAGCAVASLTGLFGCATGGALAVIGMVGGFAIFTAPALLRVQLQRG